MGERTANSIGSSPVDPQRTRPAPKYWKLIWAYTVTLGGHQETQKSGTLPEVSSPACRDSSPSSHFFGQLSLDNTLGWGQTFVQIVTAFPGARNMRAVGSIPNPPANQWTGSPFRAHLCPPWYLARCLSQSKNAPSNNRKRRQMGRARSKSQRVQQARVNGEQAGRSLKGLLSS